VRPDDAALALVLAAHRQQGAWREALRRFGSAAAATSAATRELTAFGLDNGALYALRSPDTAVLARWQEWLASADHRLLLLGSPDYPQRLVEIPDAPLALWTVGMHVELLAAPQIAVVGSRNPTGGGRATAEALAHFLSSSGVTVVSGLAVGIDAAAHRGALRAPGGTIAVLGSGPDKIYPSENTSLAAEIAATGLLVSEYAPGTPARRGHFPQRNRIIAGLTLGTLVVEATRRSGSLITARLARDYGREVFAVPGSIQNPLSRGCHTLLRDGAALVEEGADVLREIAPQIEPNCLANSAVVATNIGSVHVDPLCAKLLDAMGFEPTTIDTLTTRAGLTAAEVSSMLPPLELEGHVEALPGGRYCRLVKRKQ
jgi:DNA processing protein